MKKIVLMILVLIGLTGCYEQVPAGTKGKILGASGWQPEIIPPSKVWLANNLWNVTPERLFVVETTTKKYNEKITVLLNDKLSLGVEIVFRGRITGNDKIINAIFNDMKMNDNVVTTDEVYQVYAKMILLNTAREVISQYSVDDVQKNYKRITLELYETLEPKLSGLPIQISDVTIGSVQYPKIVTDAIESAKKRRMEIEKEQANVQIALVKAKGKEEVAKATYRIKMLEAKRIRDFNKMTAEGITDKLLELRKLEIRQQELEKWNGTLPTTVVNGNVPVILGQK